jgi:hypothetical protein
LMAQAEALRETKPAHRHRSDHRRDAGRSDREADRPAQRGGSPAPW